jgi:hypothetical protein
MKTLFENWKRYLNEQVGNIWYHTTTKQNAQSILKNGLKVNSTPNYSQASLQYMKDVYGVIPIFLAKSPAPYDNDSNVVVLEVNVDGLKLVADIPTLASSFGAYIDENYGIWFKKGDNRYTNIEEDKEISFEDLLNPDSAYCQEAINKTETAAVVQDIPPNRIKIVGDI